MAHLREERHDHTAHDGAEYANDGILVEETSCDRLSRHDAFLLAPCLLQGEAAEVKLDAKAVPLLPLVGTNLDARAAIFKKYNFRADIIIIFDIKINHKQIYPVYIPVNRRSNATERLVETSGILKRVTFFNSEGEFLPQLLIVAIGRQVQTVEAGMRAMPGRGSVQIVI